MTPLGRWPIRAVLVRPARGIDPASIHLPWRWIDASDGWSDDPADPGYNRPVRWPHGHSAEELARADQAYDAIIVLGHNDSPPLPGLGSAIFLHIWIDGRPTEGCVAISKDAMIALLAELTPEDVIDIS